MGGFLFCLSASQALHNSITRLRSLSSSSNLLAIYNDLTALIEPQYLTTAFNIISEELALIHITTSISKSQIYIHPHLLPLLPSDLPPQLCTSSEGIKLLGCPLGSEHFAQTFFQHEIIKFDTFLSRLQTLQSSQSKYHLLKFSANAKARHFIRIFPVNFPPLAQFVNQFDDKILAAFSNIFQLPSPSQLYPTTTLQIRMSDRFASFL